MKTRWVRAGAAKLGDAAASEAAEAAFQKVRRDRFAMTEAIVADEGTPTPVAAA